MAKFQRKKHAKRLKLEQALKKIENISKMTQGPPITNEQKESSLKLLCPEAQAWMNGESIDLGWPEALDPGIDCQLKPARAARKRQQIAGCLKSCYESGIIYRLHELYGNKGGFNVADFGCGSGHLGLLFAWALPTLVKSVYLLDTKAVGLEKAASRAKELNIEDKVELCMEDLSDWFDPTVIENGLMKCVVPFEFHLGVSMHSCGVLSDLSLQCCISQRSSFCLIPCCYGQLQSSKAPESAPMTKFMKRPQSNLFKENGVEYEDCDIFASCSDFSLPASKNSTAAWDFEGNDNYKVAKTAMMSVDLDRILMVNECNLYEHLWQTSLDPIHCSPKNNVICGIIPV